MKIVIVSDTHGSRKNIENVCECNPDADILIHLGDVEDDEDYIEAIFGCPTHIVGGNNDFFSRLPREEEFDLEGHHIFITHGHAYYVSMGEAHLQEEARRRGADIVMYGHTHVPALTIDADLVTLNPGSRGGPCSSGSGDIAAGDDLTGQPAVGVRAGVGGRVAGDRLIGHGSVRELDRAPNARVEELLAEGLLQALEHLS